jgi:exoribonuclease-2
MSLEGKIVEYLENGKFICGFVSHDSGSRLHLLNQNSRELNLPPNRVIHSSKEKKPSMDSKEEIIAGLGETAKQREELAQSINLDEIWETVSENLEEPYGADFLASLYFGDDPTDDQSAAFLRAVIGNRLYFKYKAARIHVNSPEKVEQIKRMQEKEKREESFIALNAAALRQIWDEDTVPESWEDKDFTLKILGEYYLFGKEAPNQELVRKLIKSAQLTGPHDIFHLMVKTGIWDKNENIPLLQSDIPTVFSDAAMAEVEKVQLPATDQLLADGRKDFRQLPVLTIDGPATRDFDDALHIEKQGDNYLVGIHITDVSLFVKPGTALFNETLNRGTSIYFPEKPLTMLPLKLSEDKLSLLKNQDRPAVSFMILLSPNAEVLTYELVLSVIKVRRQLTYEEADQLANKDRDIATLAALGKMLRQKRVNNGALLLPVPEMHIKINPGDTVEIKRLAVDTPSKTLITEFMILANTLGAQFVADREAPGLFRCQMEPRQRIIDGFEKDLVKVIQQRKRLSPMSLLTTPKVHSGVGAPQYTTVTSPIRRLLDLIMQIQISSLIQGQGIFFTKKDMKHYGNIILTTLEKANKARSLRQRYWILKYLEAKTGERVPASVIESGPRRVHLFLEDFLLDVDLPLNQAFRVSAGDTILVKLAKVDPLNNILKVEW